MINTRKLWYSIFKYEPEKFWLKRGKTFYNDNPYNDETYRKQEKKLLDYISKLDFSSVLEVGCGFGRITKLLLDRFNIREYLATEYSPDLIKHVMYHTVDFGNIQFKTAMIQELEVEKKYDLVLGTEVLQHIPPHEIKLVIDKLVSMSSKHVVNVDTWLERTPQNLARHVFIHNYVELYRKNPLVTNVNQIRLDVMNHSIFHVQINLK